MSDCYPASVPSTPSPVDGTLYRLEITGEAEVIPGEPNDETQE